jgi:hypothetical protein
VAYAPTTFFGYSMVDDFTSEKLWPPNGWSAAQMSFALNALRNEFPDIRWGCRAFPSQFGSNPGFDFYSAQYNHQFGNPASWGADQYGTAAGWNAYVWLNLNYLHGGDGSSGIRYLNGTLKGQSENNFFMSPSEVQTYFTQMYLGAQTVDSGVPKLAGSIGYQYYAPFLAQSGMLAAMVTARNALAALPPP